MRAAKSAAIWSMRAVFGVSRGGHAAQSAGLQHTRPDGAGEFPVHGGLVHGVQFQIVSQRFNSFVWSSLYPAALAQCCNRFRQVPFRFLRRSPLALPRDPLRPGTFFLPAKLLKSLAA